MHQKNATSIAGSCVCYRVRAKGAWTHLIDKFRNITQPLLLQQGLQ